VAALKGALMDKKAIKTFAIQARRSLIESIKLKLENLGITKDGVAEKMSQSTNEIEYYGDKGLSITGQDIRRRRELVARLKGMAKQEEWSDALTDLIEEVAYTWFNRIIAIRFMEVNEYLPSGVRVLSSETKLKVPDILREAFEIEDDLGGYSVDEHGIIQKALDTEDPTDMDAAYVILFTKQANALNHYLPELFEKTDDFMQLLFTPSYSSGVIKDLVDDISEDDFDVDKGGQVEIIGWLYQYYNIEPHDKVVNINGGPIKTNDIPAATQLFTTDWVVRYMVDNSLGRLYLEYFPDSPIKEKLAYLLPGPIEKRTNSFDLSQLKVLDDAMGSGHILVYAFDLLIQMYEEQGYGKRDATDAILAHNLYGLEIDKRAYQLAYFALMMKARQYNRRILNKTIRHNLHVFESTVDVPNEVFEKMKASKDIINDLRTLVSTFKQAKLLGSIMHFEKKFDFDELFSAVNSLPDSTQLDLFGLQAAKNTLQSILKIAQVLKTHFDVVATNPPYLNRMNGDLKKYVKKYYKAYSGDIFSVFIWKNIEMTKQDGYSAYMTPIVWMFLKTFDSTRQAILKATSISTLIQMETHAFFDEAYVTIDTFVIKKRFPSDQTLGTYIRLTRFTGGMDVQQKKTLNAISNPEVSYLYRTKQTNFEKIPGSPIAYWASQSLIHDFEIGTPMGSILEPRQGLATADNNRFLRQWYEVEPFRISFTSTSTEDALKSGAKWFPYNKGGSYRKWYGNYDYVVNWQNDGYEIKHFTFSNGKQRSVVRNPTYYFREAITWSKVTSGSFNIRFRKGGSIFDTGGNSAFADHTDTLFQVMAVANSPVGNYVFRILNPTINMLTEDFKNFPLIKIKKLDLLKTILNLSRQCTQIAKEDWDTFELSWEFKGLQLLLYIAEHQKSPPTKLLIFFEFCDKYVPIQFRGLIFYGQLSKKR